MDYDKHIQIAQANGDEELAAFLIELQSGTSQSAAKQTALAQRAALQEVQLQFITARHRAGLTQQQLALQVGMPQSTIARIETGRVDARLSSLLKLAEALGVEVTLQTKH